MSEDKPTTKVPIYKKWWFWVIIAFVVLAGAGGAAQQADHGVASKDDASQTEQDDQSNDTTDSPTQTDQERIQDIYSTPEKTVEYFANQRISAMDGADLISVSVAEYDRYEILVATINVEFSRGSSQSVLDSVLQSYSEKIADSVLNGVGGVDKKCEMTINWTVTNPSHADVWYKLEKDGYDMKVVNSNYK